MQGQLGITVRRILPRAVRRAIARGAAWPPVGTVQFGSLRRLRPISKAFGGDRGQPIDRYYIEEFLSVNAHFIKGRLLEIGDDAYTRRFGGGRVTQSDVLHAEAGNPGVTIVADLSRADHLPSCEYHCVILTQTLHLIYDVAAAIRTVHRILRPGGVALVTVPGISRLCVDDRARWAHYWNFTAKSARKLFEGAFPPSLLDVRAHGNVLTAISFLHGLSVGELTREELDFNDAEYEVLITVRAEKPR